MNGLFSSTRECLTSVAKANQLKQKFKDKVDYSHALTAMLQSKQDMESKERELQFAREASALVPYIRNLEKVDLDYNERRRILEKLEQSLPEILSSWNKAKSQFDKRHALQVTLEKCGLESQKLERKRKGIETFFELETLCSKYSLGLKKSKLKMKNSISKYSGFRKKSRKWVGNRFTLHRLDEGLSY